MRYNANEYSDGASAGIAPLPPGRYPFRIVEAIKGFTRSTNVEMITLKLACLDSEYPSSWVYYCLVASNPFVSQQIGSLFAAAGINPQSLPPIIEAAYFLNLVVEGQVKQETYNGKIKAVIQYFIADHQQLTFTPTPGYSPDAPEDDMPF